MNVLKHVNFHVTIVVLALVMSLAKVVVSKRVLDLVKEDVKKDVQMGVRLPVRGDVLQVALVVVPGIALAVVQQVAIALVKDPARLGALDVVDNVQVLVQVGVRPLVLVLVYMDVVGVVEVAQEHVLDPV